MVHGSALVTNAIGVEPNCSGFRSLVESNNMGGIGKPHVFEVLDHGVHSNQAC